MSNKYCTRKFMRLTYSRDKPIRGEAMMPSFNTSMRISEKGDLQAAALLAKALERLWDEAEDYVGTPKRESRLRENNFRAHGNASLPTVREVH